MYDNEWFPHVYALGYSYEEFGRMNPYIIRLIVKGEKEKQKHNVELQNALFHLQGQYFAEALLSTVGNMFSGKHSKKHKYPEKPFELNNSDNKELTEEEIQKQRELFVAKLQTMKTNFELEKGDKS